MITKWQLYNDALNAVIEKPRYWRNGQAIFNYIDKKYNVGNVIRETYNVDCFYDDTQISSFLALAYEQISKQEDNEQAE